MPQTHFGYQTVDTDEKAGLVGNVFKDVASQYDIMNDAMSFGLHRLWKDRFISELNPAPHSHLLDMAGGTGDIAFRYLKAAPTGHVTIADINEAMLDAGKENQINKNIKGDITWQCADAQYLPFDDHQFDYYTIAFGIRNVTDISLALKEAYRVLKPGGRFLCLEFSHVSHPVIKSVYDFYSFRIIPCMGKLIAGNKDAYQYLVESIRMFPDAENFKAMMDDAGFSMTRYDQLQHGIVAIHSGWKI